MTDNRKQRDDEQSRYLNQLTQQRDDDSEDDINYIPEEPDGLKVHWDRGRDDMTTEEMFEEDLHVEYGEDQNEANQCG